MHRVQAVVVKTQELSVSELFARPGVVGYDNMG